MKNNWKTAVVLLLTVAGGVGVSVAAIRNSTKPDAVSVVDMKDESMMTQPAASSCEMCSGITQSGCKSGNCGIGEAKMGMSDSKMMSMNGGMTAEMVDTKPTQVAATNTVPPSMAESSMSTKSMSMKMEATKKSSQDRMSDTPKM